MLAFQAMELDVDDAGIVVRVTYYEGSPWSGCEFLGQPLSDLLTSHGELASYGGYGWLSYGTACEYRVCRLGGFRKVSISAANAGSGSLKRLGNCATMERAVQLINQCQNLAFGFGAAAPEPGAVFNSDQDLHNELRCLALRLLEALRDPMSVVSVVGGEIAFAVPESDRGRLEHKVLRLQEEMALQGGCARWQFELLCADPPFSPAEMLTRCSQRVRQSLAANRSGPSQVA